MRYAKWPHYPHGHITHLSPNILPNSMYMVQRNYKDIYGYKRKKIATIVDH